MMPNQVSQQQHKGGEVIDPTIIGTARELGLLQIEKHPHFALSYSSVWRNLREGYGLWLRTPGSHRTSSSTDEDYAWITSESGLSIMARLMPFRLPGIAADSRVLSSDSKLTKLVFSTETGGSQGTRYTATFHLGSGDHSPAPHWDLDIQTAKGKYRALNVESAGGMERTLKLFTELGLPPEDPKHSFDKRFKEPVFVLGSTSDDILWCNERLLRLINSLATRSGLGSSVRLAKATRKWVDEFHAKTSALTKFPLDLDPEGMGAIVRLTDCGGDRLPKDLKEQADEVERLLSKPRDVAISAISEYVLGKRRHDHFSYRMLSLKPLLRVARRSAEVVSKQLLEQGLSREDLRDLASTLWQQVDLDRELEIQVAAILHDDPELGAEARASLRGSAGRYRRRTLQAVAASLPLALGVGGGFLADTILPLGGTTAASRERIDPELTLLMTKHASLTLSTSRGVEHQTVRIFGGLLGGVSEALVRRERAPLTSAQMTAIGASINEGGVSYTSTLEQTFVSSGGVGSAAGLLPLPPAPTLINPTSDILNVASGVHSSYVGGTFHEPLWLTQERHDIGAKGLRTIDVKVGFRGINDENYVNNTSSLIHVNNKQEGEPLSDLPPQIHEGYSLRGTTRFLMRFKVGDPRLASLLGDSPVHLLPLQSAQVELCSAEYSGRLHTLARTTIPRAALANRFVVNAVFEVPEEQFKEVRRALQSGRAVVRATSEIALDTGTSTITCAVPCRHTSVSLEAFLRSAAPVPAPVEEERREAEQALASAKRVLADLRSSAEKLQKLSTLVAQERARATIRGGRSAQADKRDLIPQLLNTVDELAPPLHLASNGAMFMLLLARTEPYMIHSRSVRSTFIVPPRLEPSYGWGGGIILANPRDLTGGAQEISVFYGGVFDTVEREHASLARARSEVDSSTYLEGGDSLRIREQDPRPQSVPEEPPFAIHPSLISGFSYHRRPATGSPTTAALQEAGTRWVASARRILDLPSVAGEDSSTSAALREELYRFESHLKALVESPHWLHFQATDPEY